MSASQNHCRDSASSPSVTARHTGEDSPLSNLEFWEEDLRRRYPEPASGDAPHPISPVVATNRAKESFRDYRADVVGDTFPVGCAFSKQIVFPEFFAENLDSDATKYQSRLGIYAEGCGLENVLLSWGHDEYLYHVVKDYLPPESLYMIRYHSFYPAQREGEYDYLMNDRDREMFAWVRAFNPYDLYTKAPERPNVATLRPFYEDLIDEFFPSTLHW